MNANEYYITEDKKVENPNKYKNKKDNLLDIKQNLFQELTTQSSRKIKLDENSYINSKYLNYFNLQNNEDNINHENKKEIYDRKNKNFLENKNRSEKKYPKYYMRNDKDLLSFHTKSQIQNKNLFMNSNSNYSNINIDKFNNNDDLIYIITTNKNLNEKETDDESESYHYERSHIALPFCNYHKFNILLPKQYTCNFKKCSCCAFREKINDLYENNNNYSNKYDNEKPKNNDSKNITYKSVLDKFKKKNNENKEKNPKTNKKISKNTILNNNGNINSNKDDNLKNLNKNGNMNKRKNLRSINKNDNLNKSNNSKNINKNDNLNKSNNSKNLNRIDNSNKNNNLKKLDKNENINKSNDLNKNKASNLNKTKISDSSESNDLSDFRCNFQKPNNINVKIVKNDYISENDSKNESSGIELPSDLNIDDGKYLQKYRNYINSSEKKSKLHLSVMYYKKLNKSFSQIFSKDINQFKKKSSLSRHKNIELLRDE